LGGVALLVFCCHWCRKDDDEGGKRKAYHLYPADFVEGLGVFGCEVYREESSKKLNAAWRCLGSHHAACFLGSAEMPPFSSVLAMLP
jgi:hypothetical protein